MTCFFGKFGLKQFNLAKKKTEESYCITIYVQLPYYCYYYYYHYYY